MQTKHTAGPWKAHFDVPTATIPCHIIKTDDNVARPVALVPIPIGGNSKAKPTQEANARLIAAAPELLSSLARLMEWIDAGCDPSTKSMEAARAAIAKAEGRQP